MASPKPEPESDSGSTPADGGFSAAEKAAFQDAKDTNHRNPRVVREAFLAKPIIVGSITLRPITLAVFMLLEEIESPLIEDMGESEFSIRDMASAVFILSHDEATVMESLAKSRATFEAAVLKWAATVPAPDLMALGQAVAKSLAEALATVLPTEEKKTGADAPNDSPEEAPATDSAGP